MKLLYTSDLHGEEPQYARLLTAAEAVRPDVVVLGGDLLPDDSVLVPENLGRGQPEWVRSRFRELMTQLREASQAKAIAVIFGNHDWLSSVTAMSELEKDGIVSVLGLESHFVVDGLAFIGYSASPPTPWFVKDFERLDMPGDAPPLLGGARWDPRFSKAIPHNSPLLFEKGKSIAEELEALKPPTEPWVFVAHCPPYNTRLDASRKGEPWGSKAILAAIQEHQPLLSLHGHIHESARVSGECSEKLGNTVAVNPGQSRAELQYVVVEVDVSGRRVSHVKHGQQS